VCLRAFVRGGARFLGHRQQPGGALLLEDVHEAQDHRGYADDSGETAAGHREDLRVRFGYKVWHGSRAWVSGQLEYFQAFATCSLANV